MAQRNGRQDSELFHALETHHAALSRFALLLTRSRDEAEDLVSDTYLAVLESKQEVRELAALRTYLFRIAHRLYVRRTRRAKLFSMFEADVHEPYSTEPNPEEVTDMTLIKEAMNKLSAEYKEALVLIDVLGTPLDEAADIVQLSLGGFKARLHRARTALKDLLSR